MTGWSYRNDLLLLRNLRPFARSYLCICMGLGWLIAACGTIFWNPARNFFAKFSKFCSHKRKFLIRKQFLTGFDIKKMSHSAKTAFQSLLFHIWTQFGEQIAIHYLQSKFHIKVPNPLTLQNCNAMNTCGIYLMYLL